MQKNEFQMVLTYNDDEMYIILNYKTLFTLGLSYIYFNCRTSLMNPTRGQALADGSNVNEKGLYIFDAMKLSCDKRKLYFILFYSYFTLSLDLKLRFKKSTI